MLAEVVRRRSSWLRSLATARRLSRPLQLQATAHPREDEDEDEHEVEKRSHDARSQLPARPAPSRARPEVAALKLQAQTQTHVKSSSLNNELLAALGQRPAPAEPPRQQRHVQQQTPLQPVRLPTDADPGAYPALVDTGQPADADVGRARNSLQNMARELADPRAKVKGESRYQRARRQLKAATGKLDRMLAKMQKQKDFKQVEAVAYLWEEEFPQFAGQQKHWRVICEHYALALNYQQRFQEVVDKFSTCFQENADGDLNSEKSGLLSPRLAESIFVALGHLREAELALKLLEILQRHGIRVTKIAYFHVLSVLLRDERFTDFEIVMQLCEEIVTKLPGENVPLSLLPMIIMTAAARGEADRAMKFYSHPPDLHMGPYTEFYFDICLQQLNRLEENELLMEMYRNMMASSGASRELKERVSKYLFRKKVALVTAATRNKKLDLACEILEIMNLHKIRANHHAVFPLIRALLLDPVCEGDYSGEGKWEEKHSHVRVKSAEDLRSFFARYSDTLEWNSFALCEAVVAGVRAERADFVDDLFVYALDRGMPIKYAALEQVVVFYFRMGLINDFERVADVVRALRLNQHIPLGIAVTEIGMSANLRLHRYEEVAILFEDFASLDSERRRVLNRRFMLKSALSAYKRLGRSDEAQAVKLLLDQSYSNLLEGSTFDEEERVEADSGSGVEAEGDVEGWEKEEVGLNEHGNDEKETSDSNSDQPSELEMPSLHRFNR